MSGYRELFRLRLEHAYQGADAFHAWSVELAPATRRLVHGAGIVVRRAGDAILFFAPAGRSGSLAGQSDGMQFVLLVHVANEHLASCTVPAVPPGHLLVADSRHAGPGQEGLLHPAACLAADALQPHGTPICQVALAGRTSPRQPALVVHVALDGGAAPRRYLARFDVAASYWKYVLTGAVAQRRLAIADLDGAVTFRAVDAGETGLDRRAAAFLSDRAITLRARPGQRFVLKEDGPFGERVLMKRMPVAGAGLRQRAVVDGQVVQVSEIFINQ